MMALVEYKVPNVPERQIKIALTILPSSQKANPVLFYFSSFISLLNFDNDWRSGHEPNAQAKVIVIFGWAVEAAGDVDVLWI